MKIVQLVSVILMLSVCMMILVVHIHTYAYGVCIVCGKAEPIPDNTEEPSNKMTESALEEVTPNQIPDNTEELSNEMTDPALEVTPNQYFSFTLQSDGTYSIRAQETENLPDEVILPSTYDGKDVTVIEQEAFYSYDDLKSIVIPESITSIGDMAFFSCDNLNQISLPDSLREIGNDAFSYCESLTQINLPKSLKKIGNMAFFSCDNLNQISLPDSLREIGYNAFSYCESLTQINLPKSLKKIGNRVFSGCLSLNEFAVDAQNEHFCAVDGVLYSKDRSTLIKYAPAKKETSYVILDTVSKIDVLAFEGCTNLTSIIIPNSVETIGYGAFRDCTDLISLIIPANVRYIYGSYFEGCTSLVDVGVDASNSNYYVIDGNLYNKNTDALVRYAGGKTATDFRVPDGVTSIGISAFSYSVNLMNVSIPKSVTSIEYNAFHGCTNLASIIYGGTCAEWNAVSKDEDWKESNSQCTVHCTDGIIEY